MMTLSAIQEPKHERRGYQVPLLRALAKHTAEFWCLASLTEPRLIACSQPFFDLWVVPPELATAGIGSLSSSSSPMILPAERHHRQLPPLAEFTRIVFRSTDIGGEPSRIGATEARLYDVSDQNGELVGRIVFLHPERVGESGPAKLADPTPEAERMTRLSPRELEVVEHLYQGATNRAISLQLHISEKTVEKHRANAMTKLEVTTFAEMIRLVTIARLPGGVIRSEQTQVAGAFGASGHREVLSGDHP